MPSPFFRTLFFFFILFTSLPSLAQSLSVTGKVVENSDGSSLPGAHVHLLKLADSTRQVVETDATGNFAFRNLAQGRYALTVTFVGYAPVTRPLQLQTASVVVEPIKMSNDVTTLNEVLIEGKIPIAEVKGDTISYNANAFKTNKNANADELVEKIPGLTIEDGVVKAEGENVTRITVDGREYFGDDAISTLKNLPAEVIDKVEVFERQSDRAEMSGVDDGERFKSLNIVTKPNMRNGTFGRVYAGVGPDERYIVGGVANIFQGPRRFTVLAQSNNINQQNFASEDLLGVSAGAGSRGGSRGGSSRGGGGNAGDFSVNQRNGLSKVDAIGLNYNDFWGKKIDVTGSYYGTRVDNEMFQNLNRQYNANATALRADQVYLEQNRGQSLDYEHRLNLRLNYKISDKTSLRLTPRITFQQNDGLTSAEAQTLRSEAFVNQSDRSLTSDSKGLNFSNSLLFSHRFAKPGRSVSLSFNTSYNNQEGDNYQSSFFKSFGDPGREEAVDQRSLLDSKVLRWSGGLSLTERIGKPSIVTLNYNISNTHSDSDRRTYRLAQETQDYTLLDTDLSNTFLSDYTTQSTGLGYQFNLDKIYFTAQLAYQTSSLNRDQEFPSTLVFDRSFENLIPTATFRYRFKRGEDFTVTYRTSTDAPSANQLQEVINNNNPLNLRTGNPYLDQSYQHSIRLRYSWAKPETSRVLSVSLSGNLENDYITNATFEALKDSVITPSIILPVGGRLVKPVNLDGNYGARAYVMYAMPFGLIKSKLNFSLSSNYDRTPGFINNRLNYNEGIGFQLGTVIASNISENLDFTVSSRSGYNLILNSLRAQTNNRYFTQNTSVRLKWVIWKGFTTEQSLNHRVSSGLASSFNQNVVRWNASIGKLLFKNQRGEIQLTAYDLLNQNTNINRIYREDYIQDVESQALNRYFMVSFNYHFRSFGNGQSAPAASETPEKNRRSENGRRAPSTRPARQ